MRRILRLFLAASGILVAILLLAGGAGWLWLRTSLPQTAGTIETRAVDAGVEVIRDVNGVPHIFAASDVDAYAALGYVHAQDRLWQMETMRRLGAGRLSEIFGPATLQIDRYSRTLGLYRLAQAQVDRLRPDERGLLDAYARGVNAYLRERNGALPPEFVLLRHEPEEWRPADSLVWAKIMAVRLSKNWRTELLRWRMSRTLTTQQIRELWPADDRDAPITISDRVRSAALPLGALASAIPEAFTSADASNAWVVAGARTETGKPVLANDPHLGFDAPILWYLAHIESPGLSLTGATVPGVPLLILGHNGRIAWGMTTTGGDLEDLYLEEVDPERHDHYRAPDGAKPFERRIETIGVRDGRPLAIEIRATRHGVVVSDLLGDGARENDTEVVALASTALADDDDTARALLSINRARNWTAFENAARLFHSPQQNIFYADIDGNIGMIAPARIPIRRNGNGMAPVDGTDSRHDWTQFIPFEALPRVLNPSTGLIFNANNRLVDSSYPYFITRDWDTSWRAARLAEVFARPTRQNSGTATDLQLDTLSTAARTLLPLLLDLPDPSPRAAAVLERMRRWDFRMDREAPEPLIYATWLLHLMRTIAADELGRLFDDYGRARPGFVLSVLTRNTHWCDDVTTDAKEDCPLQIRRALESALDTIEVKQGADVARWRWGQAHKAAFVHRVFERIPVIDRIVELAIETSGGDNTVNRGQSTGFGENPHRHTHGAGLRAVYDLADLAHSRFTIATGQSGNPFSPHYRDQIERWRDGGHIEISVDRNTARQRAAETLILRPSALR